jgi:hypothetical protein
MITTFVLVSIAFVAGLGIGYSARNAGIRTPGKTEAHATGLSCDRKTPPAAHLPQN